MEGTVITGGGAQIEKTAEDLREANKSNERLVRYITTTRPPFRFLHDNIISMLNAHNYHADLYSGDELNARGMERPAKIAFLQKIIDVVTEDFPAVTDLGIKITKILAGKECDITRTFLQTSASPSPPAMPGVGIRSRYWRAQLSKRYPPFPHVHTHASMTPCMSVPW